LIRQYFEVGQRARKHLYDPSPRVDHPPAPRFKRDSLRYKRRRVKERFALVAKIKRSLRRRRSHRRPVVIRKRRYLFTERSPVHTGRTVA
jgi:hypothetical protein